MTRTQQHPQPVKPPPSAQRDRAQWQSLRAPSGRVVAINKKEAEFIRVLVAMGYAKVTP